MTRPKRIYLAGPMTGLPDHNFPAFHAAARHLTAAGWEVCNPAENFGGRTDLPREQYLRADVAMLVQCDAIALLPGWEESRGAQLEYLVARELNLAIFDAQTIQPLDQDVFVRTGQQIIEACQLRISVDVWMDELQSLLDEVTAWAAHHADRITACYVVPHGARVMLFFTPATDSFDFSLAADLADLNVDVVRRFNIGMVEVRQIPTGELDRFVDPNAARQIYGEQTTELMAACHRCGCAMATVSGGTGNVTHDGKPVGNSEIGSVLV